MAEQERDAVILLFFPLHVAQRLDGVAAQYKTSAQRPHSRAWGKERAHRHTPYCQNHDVDKSRTKPAIPDLVPGLSGEGKGFAGDGNQSLLLYVGDERVAHRLCFRSTGAALLGPR